jgi:DNA-binding IscR family transcriptional regulator
LFPKWLGVIGGKEGVMIDSRVQTLVRECRNMQLHVLFVLWASTGPMSAKELAQEVNCSPDAVQQALPNLEFNGYVAQFPGGRHPRWWLTDKARQLSLPGLFGKSEGEKITLEGEKITLEGEKITLSPPTTTTAILPSLSSANAVVAVAESEGEKITLTPPAIDAKLAAAFKAAGIGSNAWPGLAKLAHVTPAYVKAHDAYRRERGESTGLLITRLRCGDPVPQKASQPGRDVAAEWQKVIDEQRGGQRRKK